MSDEPDTFSHSEVDVKQKCDRMWFYNYVLGIEPIGKSEALSRGTLGHIGLEQFFKTILAWQEDPGTITWDEIFAVAKQDAKDAVMQEVSNDPSTMIMVSAKVLSLLNTFFENYPFLNWHIVAVEQVMMLPVTIQFSVPIIVDLIAQDPYGDVWVIDHKFVYNFLNDIENDLFPQLPLYVGVCRAAGLNVDKAAYNMLRTRDLKNPSASDLVRFSEVPLTNERVQRTFIEHALIAAECERLKNTYTVEELSYMMTRVKNGFICQRCSFKDICTAELNGHQPELVLASFYRKRQRRNLTNEVSPTPILGA